MAAIELSGGVKRFGPISAVDGLDLDVPEGICLGLLGPNGAGKSTTMRVLTGPATPDPGGAEVGVAPQPNTPDPGLPVEHNLGVYARLYRVKDVGAAVDRC